MESEGLYTQVWGPSMWESLHNITFNYPYNPTEEDKENYYNFFMSLKDVLPCSSCRKNYASHIMEGNTKLTYEVFASRETLTKWLYNLHKLVSSILGYNDDISYEMLCKKHNSFIAKGDFTEEQKKNAFVNLYNTCSCVLKEEILSCFAKYAKKRGFLNFTENVKKYSNMSRDSKEWYDRNQKCQEQLKYMRINGIPSLEREGEHEGLPTIDELKLMELTSTSLSKKKIKKILKENLKCQFVTKYIFNNCGNEE
jgi:hypothetical protein